jgi:protein-disulfide isomerase
VITEFVDFQCPFCAAAAPLVDSLVTEASDVALVLVHMPLANHPQALPAAIAVECAHRQARTHDYTNALFANQDSLGTTSWLSFAEQVGGFDLSSFGQCVELPSDSFPRIATGLAVAEEHGVSGTPTFWVNGRLTGRSALRRIVTEHRDSKRQR